MLKALELFGFKSFADKTRFEFPAGITVVVGPNGSGKSNIVDGIKWVLGEQSAKSLRGKEMADVIFKGSGTGGRKPMNAAEATVVFDNSEGRLPVDAPEVHVTRRVYRGGEAEYLINRQPARLKDIKDMFRGTGVGTDAYSIIEQGKVDKLLQATSKDRRAIFEEAAGISRFKAKKIEAQRRLERVDQNLLRLRDIVEEVESRLKSVRSQAAKAKRYREHSERLQELRTQVALTDWRALSDRVAEFDQQVEQLRDASAASAAQAELLEAQILELEAASLACAEESRLAESRAARNRAEIAQHELTILQQRARTRELEDETFQHRRNLAAMSDRAGDVKQRLRDTQAEVDAANDLHQSVVARVLAAQVSITELSSSLAERRREYEARQQLLQTRLQASAVLHNEIAAQEKQLVADQTFQRSLESQLAELLSASQTLAGELTSSRQRHAQLEQQVGAKQKELESAQADLSRLRARHAIRQEEVSQLQGGRRVVAERVAILEELEKSLEGLGIGVKQILSQAKESGHGSLQMIRGVLADLLTVQVEYAPAMDIALGEAAQLVVVQGGLAEVREVATSTGELPGRVTFIGTDSITLRGSELDVPATYNDAAIVGLADELVDAGPQYQSLLKRFLGRTLLVKTLDDAVRLRDELPTGKSLRFVTLTCELLDEQGALAVGPRQLATSLISRRSELRACRQQLTVLDEQIESSTGELAALVTDTEARARAVRDADQQSRSLSSEQADARLQVRTLEERIAQIVQRETALQTTQAEVQSRVQSCAQILFAARTKYAADQGELATERAEVKLVETQIAQFDGQLQDAAREATVAQVERAKSEQRLEGLQARLAQFEDDQRERQRTLNQVRQQLVLSLERREACDREILAAQAHLAALFLQKEELARELAAHLVQRDASSAQRNAQAESLATLHKQIHKLHEKQHQVELAASQVRHERQTLVDRLKEDYGIDLAGLTEQATTPEADQQRAELDAEVESLRRKINQIGAVNLDALDELDELESRFQKLSGQHQDLSDAKQALERIIQKINADSRRLFVETLEAIRINFQALYRKAFGGGKADIVLEEGVDVLDAGVEIIATPPGKPSFNNSLLSGGEKALTAVALLLAIFQFRPSPFCVLDEVDAPFDEANIGRFVDVLKEFLGWTKFVIVTHSKKTMTAATTLYGVTMQESGVSKRVSVRFDDVTEDGHIKSEALKRLPVEPVSGEPEAERGVA